MFKDDNGRWLVSYETKDGHKRMYFAKYQASKKTKNPDDVISTALLIPGFSTPTFESQLKDKVCEFCGDSVSSRFEVHPVNKVKNLKGKDPWERVMFVKRRKTLVVCKKCHYKIHNPYYSLLIMQQGGAGYIARYKSGSERVWTNLSQ